MDMKPTIKTSYDVLTRNGTETFILIPIADYEALLERLEDAHDVLLIEDSRRRNAGKPGMTHEQMLTELGLKPARRKANSRT